MEFNLFKVEYNWFEGEHEEALIGKSVERKEFEKDLLEAKNFAISLKGKKAEMGDYLGKGYSVECLPEFYEQILWFLTNKKEYIECYFDEDMKYGVDDTVDSKKISITKFETKVEGIEL